MMILLLIALSLYAAIFLTLAPSFIKLLTIATTQKEFELFKTITKDSTSYVNQLSLSNEYTSEDKKSLANTYALQLLDVAGISRFSCLIDQQIESSLWCDDNEIVEDDGDEDEDF
jgi:hypothetical protein